MIDKNELNRCITALDVALRDEYGERYLGIIRQPEKELVTFDFSFGWQDMTYSHIMNFDVDEHLADIRNSFS